MSIVNVRIDGRLIHGQVANLWSTKLQVDRIMVVDNKVAEDPIEKSGLKMATPTGVKLSVLPVEKASANILAGKYDSQRLLIISRKPQQLLQLVATGVPIKEINVGNMSQNEHTKKITKSINVESSDIADFEALAELGVHLISQMVPGEKAEDFLEILKKNS